MDIVEVE